MDIQTRKIEFVQAFLELQNEGLIAEFENLLQRVQNDYLPITQKQITKATLNKRIKKSEEDFKNKRYKSSSELLLKYK